MLCLYAEYFEEPFWGHSSMLNFDEILDSYGAKEEAGKPKCKLVPFVAAKSPVVYAGEIVIGKDGKLKGINNKCGRFKPEAYDPAKPHLAKLSKALGVDVVAFAHEEEIDLYDYDVYDEDGMSIVLRF